MALVWLRGGPSTGKSSIGRQVLKAAAPGEAWILTGDEHLTSRIPRRLIAHHPPGTAPGDGWHVTMLDGRVHERPVAGPVALRLLDAMYRGAAVMAATGVHVLIEDVVWGPAELEVAHAALAGVDPVVVQVRCPLEVARRRERERGDRHPGSVDQFARDPDVVEHPDLVLDTTTSTSEACAAELLDLVRARGRTPSGSGGR